ncbi:alpha-1,3-arabinosyltransferase XAT3 isoform X2 [Neltuma alba]|uniref:alpha-1,3-arabinosyltransferase XAT3 isoform X2 n=1 Tax=Neltuma alba TaxID=207710 RepID=UPI0010A37EC6|nr:alpha-1,3-arabinosyltransferase XAT3-like isoform X2 [Prosopis alba]XP_028803705.1 alpha-1,3-arabinosyltransferase XAT3-like isoform X2 [Prosopis alba]
MVKKKNPGTAGIAVGCLAAAFVFVLVLEMNYSPPSTVRPIRLSQAHHSQAGNTSRESGASKIGIPMGPTVIKQELRDPPPLPPPIAKAITCDRSRYFYDICSIHVPTVLDPTISTFFINHPLATHSTVEKIRPYPRKWENFTMSRIKEVTITTSSQPIPICHVTHVSPALVFSAGGYTGNFFHEMSDGFIPLFITVNSIFNQNQDVVLVISKARDWWVRKYITLLQKISKHQIIVLENDTSLHCFPSATLGLISHGFLAINQDRMPNSKSLDHFHEFLGEAFRTNNNDHSLIIPSRPQRPRVVLMNRPYGSGRVLLNMKQVKLELEKVGFDVIVFEPTPTTPLHQSFALINSSHAMIGIHGAALTHLLFLRSGATFIQVVPLGTEWVAEACFGNAARAKGLEYIEYRITAAESSLLERYGKEDMIIKDPIGFLKGKSWSSGMKIYLKEQNVRLDLARFRKYLKEAYHKAKEFMDNEPTRQN